MKAKVWTVTEKHYQLNEALQRDGEPDETVTVCDSRKLAKAKIKAVKAKLEAKTDEDGEPQSYDVEAAKDGLSVTGTERSALVELEAVAEEKEVETDGKDGPCILTTLTVYEQTNERAVYSVLCPNRKAAERAMRKEILKDIKDYYEGDDEEHDYKKLVDDAINDGGEEHDAMMDWTADRVYTYDIFPTFGTVTEK